MRELLGLLRGLVGRLNRPNQRRLLMYCTAAMAIFAGTTGTAVQAGNYSELAAGAIMLGVLAVVCATVWSALRVASRPALTSRP